MSDTASSPRPVRGLLDRIFAPFDNVWLGITLLALLFVYCSIGSAGIFRYVGGPLLSTDSWIHAQLRADRGLEMTEYEWFHWWPFDVLIGLICLNLSVVTVRRIKPNAINAGVWLIHSGIIVLAIGCLWYYSTKIEGDAPVLRGELAITLPSGETATLPTVPGAQKRVRAPDGPWDLRVWSTEPQWSLASGDDEGKTAYSVMLEVSGPQGRFLRQVLAGYPEYTEDMIFTDDPRQPMKRAVKELGKPLLLDDLQVELSAPAARWFYMAHWIEKSWALYVRERTPDNRNEWVQRPIEGLPLYNDYISSYEDVWLPHGRQLPLDPIDVVVPSQLPGDPLEGVPVRIDTYLRYAQLESRRVDAGHNARFDPMVKVLLDDGTGERFNYELAALDPEKNSADGGFLDFVLIEGPEDSARLTRQQQALLEVSVGGGELLELPITDFSMRNPALAWTAVGDSGYEVRVEFIEDKLQLSADQTHSMASVEVRGPEQADGERLEFRRWVFDDARLNRDVTPRSADGAMPPHGAEPGLDIPDGVLETDGALSIVYQPGSFPRPISIAAMADGTLGVALNLTPGEDGRWFEVELGEPVALGRGATMTLTEYSAHGSEQVRPYVVPPEERVRNMQHKQSMVRVRIPMGGRSYETWVPYHEYPIHEPAQSLRRYRYQPSTVRLDDGRQIEFVFSRQRYALPTPVRLDHFELATHTGGFTGTTQSIRNWTSFVSFDAPDGPTEPLPVSVNQPVEFKGISFFQAQWDPPSGPRFRGDVASSGLNYTVLGVGNRNGVMIQLIGTCISVLGMLYAFYYKPILLRRRKAQRSSGGGSGSRSSVARPSASGRPVAVSASQDEHS